MWCIYLRWSHVSFCVKSGLMVLRKILPIFTNHMLQCGQVGFTITVENFICFVVFTPFSLNGMNITIETCSGLVKNNPLREQKTQHATVVYEEHSKESDI